LNFIALHYFIGSKLLLLIKKEKDKQAEAT